MTNLTSLILQLDNNIIGDVGVQKLGESLNNMNNLIELSLHLEDNYIDNTGFEVIVIDLE